MRRDKKSHALYYSLKDDIFHMDNEMRELQDKLIVAEKKKVFNMKNLVRFYKVKLSNQNICAIKHFNRISKSRFRG